MHFKKELSHKWLKLVQSTILCPASYLLSMG
jgi:hypothetical protein